jgi:signal transduction histidine kinase
VGLIRRALDSFAGRVLLTCAAVLAALLLASLYLHDALISRAAQRGTAEIVAERLVSVVEALAAASPADRPAVARALSAPDLDVQWRAEAAGHADEAEADRFNLPRIDRLAEETAEVHATTGGIDAEREELRWVGISARLRDGTWVDARLATVSLLGASDAAFHGTIGAVAAALLVVAGLAARAIASPLAKLAKAVDRLEPGGDAAIPRVGGPGEVRRVAEALDAMTGRVRDVLRQRSLTLAALSHDLMTPIARLKLRSDELPDEDAKRALLRDLAEMERMVADALAFLRGSDDAEPTSPISVAALVMAVADEFAEDGHEVEERRLDDATVQGRPVALKRAVRNLVGNAVRHAHAPWVEVEAREADVLVRVGDRGSGISPTERERVFEPFFRGDRARAAGGGSGLGLPTARAIAEAHGGGLDLAEAPGGGTVATLRLPRRRDAAPARRQSAGA